MFVSEQAVRLWALGKLGSQQPCQQRGRAKTKSLPVALLIKGIFLNNNPAKIAEMPQKSARGSHLDVLSASRTSDLKTRCRLPTQVVNDEGQSSQRRARTHSSGSSARSSCGKYLLNAFATGFIQGKRSELACRPRSAEPRNKTPAGTVVLLAALRESRGKTL